jgi:two-component system, response regulator PdtaR
VTQFDPIAAPATTLDGLCVLVVEDEFLIQLELEALLTDAGACVVGPCRNVANALEIAEREVVDLALLDVRLGRNTVVPVARLLRSRGIPFVFYTGQTGVEPMLAEWPDAVILPKPSDRAEIIRALQAATEPARVPTESTLIAC